MSEEFKFTIGDKVTVTEKLRTWNNRNSHGEMDSWIGKPMTVRHRYMGDSGKMAGVPIYKMMEDYGEFKGEGWNWGECVLQQFKLTKRDNTQNEDINIHGVI